MITDREIIMAIVDNDCLKKSDVAVLLEGDGFFRLRKAIDLYKCKIVDKIVFSGNAIDKSYGSYPYEEIKPLLIEGGVLENDLIHENVSLNTREQAVEIVKMARLNNWKKIALIASDEHQYRAYLTFLREVIDSDSDLMIYNAPVGNLQWFVDSGWGTRIERLKTEFVRIEKYSKLGHLANVKEVIEYQKWKESID